MYEPGCVLIVFFPTGMSKQQQPTGRELDDAGWVKTEGKMDGEGAYPRFGLWNLLDKNDSLKIPLRSREAFLQRILNLL